VNLLLFIGVWLRTSGASKRVQGEENEEEGTAMSDEDVNKLVGTSQSC